jgi:transcriptional regulator with XRE-family HTH domain
MLHKVFQQRLKEERATRGLTQAAVAQTLGISQPAYADIESGPSEPRLSTIERLAAVLEIEPCELLVEKSCVR